VLVLDAGEIKMSCSEILVYDQQLEQLCHRHLFQRRHTDWHFTDKMTDWCKASSQELICTKQNQMEPDNARSIRLQWALSPSLVMMKMVMNT